MIPLDLHHYQKTGSISVSMCATRVGSDTTEEMITLGEVINNYHTDNIKNDSLFSSIFMLCSTIFNKEFSASNVTAVIVVLLYCVLDQSDTKCCIICTISKSFIQSSFVYVKSNLLLLFIDSNNNTNA